MSRNASKRFLGLAAAGIIGTALAYTPVSHAFNFGDMMNPGKWMGGGGDRYDDDYDDDGPYGYGGPYGGGPYGGGPYGGYGGPYGGPGGGPGYGGPGYGGPGYYGGGPGYYGGPGSYGRPSAGAAPAPAAPSASSSSSSNTKSAEIEALKRRIDELETKQQPPAPAPTDWDRPSSRDWSSAPAFRPLNKN